MLRLKIVHHFLTLTCKTVVNCVFVDEANHFYITMPIYNLIEYSDNYSDTSGSLWQLKRDEVPANNVDLSIGNSKQFNTKQLLFKYKAALVGKTKDFANQKSSAKDTKIVIPLKYLSNFWRSLEIPLINCKVNLELNWIEDCILSSDENFAKFEIADAKLYVPIVTLSAKDSVNLTKQLSEEFKRSVYWNSYQTKPVKVIEKEKTYMNYLIHHFKVLEDCLFLLMLLLQVLHMMKQALKTIKSIFFQEERLIITTY